MIRRAILPNGAARACGDAALLLVSGPVNAATTSQTYEIYALTRL